MEPHSLHRHVINYIYICFIYYMVVELQEGELLHVRKCHSLRGREGVEDTSLERLG
jgi:hypothetical protein